MYRTSLQNGSPVVILKSIERIELQNSTSIPSGVSDSINNPDREFRVGDKVWCVAHGQGTVMDVRKDFTMSVRVVFDIGGAFRYYHPEGLMVQGGPRCLFFSLPEVKGDTVRPYPSKIVGKLVEIEVRGTSSIKAVVLREDHDTITYRPYMNQTNYADYADYGISKKNIVGIWILSDQYISYKE